MKVSFLTLLNHKAEWIFPQLSKNGPVHFRFKGSWVVFSIFYSNLNRTLFKQAVETQIRRLALFACVPQTLGSYGLNS